MQLNRFQPRCKKGYNCEMESILGAKCRNSLSSYMNFVLLLIVRTILTLLVNTVAHLPALSQCRCSFILAQHKPSCIIHFQDICEWIYYTIFIACTKNIKRFGNLIIHDVMSHFHSRYFQLP